jgi:hypothetical protein
MVKFAQLEKTTCEALTTHVRDDWKVLQGVTERGTAALKVLEGKQWPSGSVIHIMEKFEEFKINTIRHIMASKINV